MNSNSNVIASNLNVTTQLVHSSFEKNGFSRVQLYKERLRFARNLFYTDLLAHYGCVNAIEFSQDGHYLLSGGDDRRVLLWTVSQAIENKGTPVVLKSTHASNIFCLGFDSKNRRIFSAGNDDQVIVHDAATTVSLDVFPHMKPVYGLSIHPQNDDIFTTSGEDGRLLTYDIRESPFGEPVCLAKSRGPFHAVMYNPMDGNLLCSASTSDGITLWDARYPGRWLMELGEDSKLAGMGVRWNRAGTQILALRRRQPPVLYSIHQKQALCVFFHVRYRNSCTMKSCTFAGENDEFVLSGSDDFNLYAWKINENDFNHDVLHKSEAHLMLTGHRSIVNQVRYNPQLCLIASSGVEKMVKIWSPIKRPQWKGSLEPSCVESAREFPLHSDNVSNSGSIFPFMPHVFSELSSTSEDTSMLAFFDLLLQRERDGIDSGSFFDVGEFSSDSSIMSSAVIVVSPGVSDDDSVQSPVQSSVDEEQSDGSRLGPNTRAGTQQPNSSSLRYRRGCNVPMRRNRIAQLIAQKQNTRNVTRSNSMRNNNRTRRTNRLRLNQSLRNKRNERRKKVFTINNRPRLRHQNTRTRSHPQDLVRKRRLNALRQKNLVKNMTNSKIFNVKPQLLTSPMQMDTPSTSTGITVSSSSFRSCVSSDVDSDSETYTLNSTRVPKTANLETLCRGSSSRSSVESDSRTANTHNSFKNKRHVPKATQVELKQSRAKKRVVVQKINALNCPRKRRFNNNNSNQHNRNTQLEVNGNVNDTTTNSESDADTFRTNGNGAGVASSLKYLAEYSSSDISESDSSDNKVICNRRKRCAK